MTECPTPKLISVPCYNTRDGCTGTISYMGVGRVRKICRTCQESGVPAERHQSGFSFCRSMRKVKVEGNQLPFRFGKRFDLDLDGADHYEITAWPKTVFGGRVMPYRTEE